MLKPTKLLTAALATAMLATASTALASQRRFVYSSEVLTAPRGSVELENWATWKHSGNSAIRKQQFDFSHEVEIGVTDRLQLGIYLLNWRTVKIDNSPRSTTYRSTGIECIYNLSNPNTDWVGAALYGEVKFGDRSFELESKLLLQKNLGSISLVYNAILEAEWEGNSISRLNERTGEFAQTLGISHQISPSVMVGAELLHEIEMPDWQARGKSLVFAGPNVSVREGRTFATLAALFRVTKHVGEPVLQTRLIVGIDF